MGTLIARNHDEIDQLRHMGTRDYYEFTVTRKAGAQKVGAVQVELKSTNQKKNQFTINVLADDKNFEKKNRSVNEPIFFYTGGSRAALELVVNKVTKSSASGYLSVPRLPAARRQALPLQANKTIKMLHLRSNSGEDSRTSSLIFLSLSGDAEKSYYSQAG